MPEPTLLSRSPVSKWTPPNVEQSHSLTDRPDRTLDHLWLDYHIMLVSDILELL